MDKKVAYQVYAFEIDSAGCDKYLLTVCPSEEKAKEFILNLIKESMIKYGDRSDWIYSLSNLPTENDFDVSDNSIIISQYDDGEGFYAETGYYYSKFIV